MKETALPPKKMAKNSGRERGADGSRDLPRPVLRNMKSAHVRASPGPVSDRYEERIGPEYWLG